MVKTGDLERNLPARPLPDEIVDLLLERPGLRIERIVSTGQTTPEGQWYDQETDEWVLVIAGAARLRIDGEVTDRELGEGDWILLRPIAGIASPGRKPNRRRSGSPYIFLVPGDTVRDSPRRRRNMSALNLHLGDNADFNDGEFATATYVGLRVSLPIRMRVAVRAID